MLPIVPTTRSDRRSATPSTSHHTTKRAWFAALAVVILTAGGACSSNRPSTSAPHAMDPRSMSQAEIHFGVSPTHNNAVTYQARARGFSRAGWVGYLYRQGGVADYE